ncbi:hypothetical protein DdX_10407 [Ditylenchus destructor]|uniref:Immunoglobulin domain-containing protein n=1 Tax=Ditylenchus destructor TaxID=166010 RepID=A0AAD4N4C5_9BILA|nr:hypothetical protein DdX_10407 [Ditylenchus destructor]
MLEPCASIEHSLAEIELGEDATSESDTGMMKKKSSMVQSDLVYPNASQTAPPDPFIQKPQYSSLKEGLDKLNDDQLERLVNVIGKDMRFKHELYEKLRNLNYKQREWRILLWPLTSESFGWAKFSRLSKVSPARWTVRAKLELHLVHQLESSQKGCALDSAFIDFNVTDLILEASRQKMVVVLMDFTNSGHFAHIDHAIEDVKATLSYLSLNELIVPKFPILKLIKSFNDVPIVFKLVREKWTIIPMKSGIISIFYQKQSFPWLWPPGTLRNSRTSIHVNCIDEAQDFSDSASQYSNISSSNSLSQPNSASPNNAGLVWRWKRVSQCRIDEEIPELEMDTRKASLKAISENADNSIPSKSENETRNEDKGFISIAMEQKTVEAMAGQVVTIRCVINVDEKKRVCLQRPLKLIWYNRRRQIPTISKTGRIRITTVGGDDENSIPSTSIVEIFDCDSFKDSGDIVCVAVGDCVIGSVQAATARLVIHEDDIAGEEPFFTDSLSLCGASENSYSLQQRTVSEGEPLFLKCRVIGHPQPYMKFFISGSDKRLIPIDAFDKNYKISNNNEMWILQVNKLKLSTNSTLPTTVVYVAIAMNRIGKARSGIQLRVLNKMKADDIL